MLGAVLVFAALLLSAPATYAQSADPSGHWVGTVNMPTMEIAVEVDFVKSASGLFSGTLSTPPQKVFGLPLSKVDVTATSIAFAARTDQRFAGALSADGNTIAVSTHRGLYRSADGGKTWLQAQGSLPVHLEAGALVRDPHEAGTVYVPFSLTPYHEIRRRALEGSNLLSQIDTFSLIGAGAFFILFVVAGGYAVRKLMQSSSERTSSTGTS